MIPRTRAYNAECSCSNCGYRARVPEFCPGCGSGGAVWVVLHDTPVYPLHPYRRFGLPVCGHGSRECEICDVTDRQLCPPPIP